MLRIVLSVLSVAALVYVFAGDDARHGMVDANQSRCAAFAANDLECPYSK